MEHSDKNYYNQNYYQHCCGGGGYERGNGWEEIFAGYSQRILQDMHPEKTLDAGCAKGFFVEAMRDRGVEAFGIDISEYAVMSVREDIRPYCRVQSVLEPIEGKYDLITCIEVLEHLHYKDVPLAIQNLCAAADDILFSSTPFDYAEESHVSVHTPAYWAEQFAYQGFYHDVQYDCSYISVQAMRFRKAPKNKIDLIREYESELFQKHQELTAVRQRYKTCRENVGIYKDAYQKHVDMINQELNPKIRKLEEMVRSRERQLEQSEQETAEIKRKYEEKLRETRLELEADIRRKVEERCRMRLEEELKRRKRLEEKYYENEDAGKQAQDFKIELNQAMATIAALQRENDKKNGTSSFWRRIAKRIRNKQMEQKLLRKDLTYWSPVFDPGYYAQHNRDIYEAYGMDEQKLLKHFIYCGMQEGRRANEDFDVAVYMRCNPDVAKLWKYDKRAAFLHYITDGMAEGRRAR